jgi:hypothetical protein
MKPLEVKTYTIDLVFSDQDEASLALKNKTGKRNRRR